MELSGLVGSAGKFEAPGKKDGARQGSTTALVQLAGPPLRHPVARCEPLSVLEWRVPGCEQEVDHRQNSFRDTVPELHFGSVLVFGVSRLRVTHGSLAFSATGIGVASLVDRFVIPSTLPTLHDTKLGVAHGLRVVVRCAMINCLVEASTMHAGKQINVLHNGTLHNEGKPRCSVQVKH